MLVLCRRRVRWLCRAGLPWKDNLKQNHSAIPGVWGEDEGKLGKENIKKKQKKNTKL